MDAQIRAIERRFDADPLDPEPARQLARLHLRQGGQIQGRGIDAWIDELLAARKAEEIRRLYAILDEAHPYCALALPAILARFGRGLLWGQAIAFIRRRGRWALPFLIEALTQDDYMTRARAIEGLGALGAEAAPALDIFERAFQDPHTWVRHKAVEASGRLGAAGRGLLPALRARIFEDDQELAVKAVLAVARIDGGDGALPGLRPGLISEERAVRRAARSALLELIDPRTEAGLEQLRRWSRSGVALERFACLIVLTEIQNDLYLEGIPEDRELVGLLNDCRATFSRSRLGDDRALLVALLQDPRLEVAGRALDEVGHIARAGEAWGRDVLEDVFQLESVRLHEPALRLLERIGPISRPVMTRLLNHPSEFLRAQARRVLQKFDKRIR